MKRLKPTPTEYKGVRFRSKSEAIFAYTLDCYGVVWFYEPECDPEGHKWDFLVFWPFRHPAIYYHKSSSQVYEGPLETHYTCVFIEYKPTKPTNTYVDCLCDELKRTTRGKQCYLVVYGNPWDYDSPCDYIHLPEGGKTIIGSEIVGNFLECMYAGTKIRFDLSQGVRS